jgi:hypothetical protein
MVDGGEVTDALAPIPVGVRYDPSESQPLDEWSVAVYDELKSWASNHFGRWEFWEPGYLVLTLDTFEGVKIEPVVIDTYEGKLTITFGYWEAHLPGDGIYDDTDSHRAAVSARDMASRWFRGELATAIYFSALGKWCGSKALDEPVDLKAVADIDWIENFSPARVEIRKAQASQWRHFEISNGELSATR